MLLRIVVIVSTLLVAYTLAAASAKAKVATSAQLGSVGIANEEPNLVKSSQAIIDRKNKQLEGDFAGLKTKKNNIAPTDVKLAAQANAVNAKLKSGQTLTAQGTQAKGSVSNGKGATATMDNSKLPASAGTQSNLRAVNAKGNAQNIVATGNGADSKDSFSATNAAINTNIDPAVQTKTSGNGQIAFDNLKNAAPQQFYLYDIGQSADGKVTTGKIQDKTTSPGRSQKSWLCTAAKVGESTCVDQNGNYVGKVLADNQMNTVVYNKQGLPIARGQAMKQANGQYVVAVNKKTNADVGLFSATVSNYAQSDCYKEVTGKNPAKTPDVTIKSVRFVYNEQKNANGTTTIQWPDCFDVITTVNLASGINIQDLALELQASIKPLGSVRCMDAGTCGRECYYCDMCKQSNTKLDVLDNVQTNACSLKGGRDYEIKTTVCPPPEDFKSAQCTKFDRSLTNVNYWKTHNGVEAKVLIWQRPANADTLQQRWFNTVNSPIPKVGEAFRATVQASYKLDNPEDLKANLTNEELLQYYIRKNGKEQLLSCRKGVVDYNLGGEKVNSNFLIQAATAATDSKNGNLDIFSDKPCDSWVQLQNQQYAEKAANATGKPSLLGSLGSLLGGRK